MVAKMVIKWFIRSNLRWSYEFNNVVGAKIASGFGTWGFDARFFVFNDRDSVIESTFTS